MTPPAGMPTLRGSRVTLVPVPTELARAVTAGGDVGAALLTLGLVTGRGWPHEDTADALRPVAEHGADGTWLVVLDGAVIGDAGWLGGPAEDGDCEIGYGLAAPYRRRGLGSEAVGVLCDWAGDQPGVRRLTAEVLVGNEPSVRLLTALGFQVESRRASYVRLVRPGLTGSDEAT